MSEVKRFVVCVIKKKKNEVGGSGLLESGGVGNRTGGVWMIFRR